MLVTYTYVYQNISKIVRKFEYKRKHELHTIMNTNTNANVNIHVHTNMYIHVHMYEYQCTSIYTYISMCTNISGHVSTNKKVNTLMYR